MHLEQKPKIMSLFSGCGGLDLGAKLAGCEIVWANEFNPDACNSYRRNFGGAHLVEGSIEDVDFNTEIPKPGEIDVILGGFPCQDFSMIWKRPGLEGSRGNLYTYFVQSVNKIRPLAFVAENVKGILSANKGMAIKTIVDDFQSCGYRIQAKLVNFADYGVPQTRERVFIVGIRNDLHKTFKLPSATHAPAHKAEEVKLKPYIGSKEALRGVEKVAHNNEHQNIKDKTRELLSLISPGGNFSDVPKDHPRYVKGMISHVYRRLHPDLPSTTIIASGGGGTWGYHYADPRPLTNRERARLFGYPDDFIFEGSITEVRRQIGNSVPPTGSKVIMEALISQLKE